MESESRDGVPRASCCAGGPEDDKGSSGNAANCSCCASPAGGGPRIKMLISGIVILAALGVGLLSLKASRGGGGSATPAGSAACCPGVVSIGTPGQPVWGGSCDSTSCDSSQAATPAGDNSKTPCCAN